MKLTVIEDGVRTDLELEQSVIRLGRALDNDIRLANTLVSRHHSRIEAEGDGAWIVDLGSANGTSVNGERVERQRLEEGDEISLGSGVRVLVRLEEGEARTRLLRGPDLERDGGFRTLSDEARRERENLRAFAEISRQLVAQTELEPLLRLIVDSAVTLVGGERGFVLLAEPPEDGATEAPADVERMTVSVARSFDKTDVVVPRSRLSMGIARRVVHEGRAVLSLDAGQDERFDGMASVEELRLRSVLCLPVRSGRGHVDGVLYVDNRLQFGAFDHEDLELVELFAAQAGIAIRNARLVAELREHNHRLEESRRQIARLNEQLGRKVRDRDTELAVVRAELGRERGRYDYTAIVGASDSMRRVFQQLDRIIESDLPVLIHGESGTGKELIARAIHKNGARRDKAFVTENCAALPDTLLESELFGHARGAFTGAYKSKKGLLEQADGGTLFLDEIGDMSPEMQKKLLRVLQEGEFRVLGSDQVVKVDVRVLAASHRNLEEMVREGTFREDLYYRIAVLSVNLPSLRERRDDIPILADHLLARAAREAGREVPHLPHDVVSCLVSHDWPGNVRELENEMRRLVVLAQGEVRPEHLSDAVREGRSITGEALAGSAVLESGDIKGALADLERRSIEAALAQAGGNKSRAAKALGISRFALQRKLEKYGLNGGKQGEG